MSIEAMKQALEALGWYCRDTHEAAITALRQAIAEAEKQEPVAFVSGYTNGECVVMPMNRATIFSVGTAFYTAPVHASDMSQERVDETAKYRHEWVDLTQEEVDEIYAETQDEFQFSQLLAYKLREKNFGFGSHTTKKDDNLKEMVEKGTKAWVDTPDDWVDELRGGIESRTKVGTNNGVLHKEWVGLTDEEIYDYADKFLYQHGSNYGIKSFGKAIEAKLKEKNT